ncbi:MAG TPA: beta-ketoacyl synthase N-terminal-like domain-containing protein, partial [Rhizobium sp.]|nr:beta-ketoacyl synthase N-terminal-like domain-containing protein [Rhizobium sp.]
MHEPIVITGLGAVSPLGAGVDATWSRLLAGESGIRTNTRFDTEGWKCRIAGLVPSHTDDPQGFDPEAAMDPRELRRSDLFIHYAMAAAKEALDQAGWHPEDPADGMRTATIIGTGVGGVPAITAATELIRTSGTRRLSPFVVPSFLPNLATGQASIRFGFHGPSGAPVTACAASAQAIGDAMRMIRNGEA